MSTGPYYVGVDVGTGSVRAALVTSTGHIVRSASQVISISNPQPDFYEQSSEEIWQACCRTIQIVTQDIRVNDVHGIGFDATCSLVVLDDAFKPLAVSRQGGAKGYDVIMWLDHRAGVQAKIINDTRHDMLQYTGGAISLEMQLPKLIWLKQNRREDVWQRAGHFMDLPDYLTWRATGDTTRSLCSVVCKWLYEANESIQHWNDDFLRCIGLDDLVIDGHKRIGARVLCPGDPCGAGISPQAAVETGLLRGTPVGTSIIDAHAGGLGTLGCLPDISDAVACQPDISDIASIPLTARLALICGTSTCHMKLSTSAVFVPGVWGPYYSALIPHLWLNEGGQSATGKLLDHVITSHPAYPKVKDEAQRRQVTDYAVLYGVLASASDREGVSVSQLTRHYHVLPDYHGNRSPRADPTSRGMICGLSLTSGVEDLAIQYLATLQSLAYGTLNIMAAMRTAGHTIELVCLCGGLAKNDLFVQQHADIIGVPLVLPETEESVLLGAAILGACASQDFTDLTSAMSAMSGRGRVVLANNNDTTYHKCKYEVFVSMTRNQEEYKRIMSRSVTS